MMEDRHRVLVVGGLLLVWSIAGAEPQPERSRPEDNGLRTRAAAIVQRIQRADYEADRGTLRTLSAELAAFEPVDRGLQALILYWQGFARWRSAINGFNDGETPEAIESDVAAAIQHFEEAHAADPDFVDATSGLISCLGYRMYLHREERARLQELIARVRPLIADATRLDPDHPRLLWVLGPSRWNTPLRPGEDAATRQAGVIASYERALATLRGRPRPADPLLPAWGEPELLMNLAWSQLNKTTPDPGAAERYATEALSLVPHWHYVRDILLPQIRKAPRPRH